MLLHFLHSPHPCGLAKRWHRCNATYSRKPAIPTLPLSKPRSSSFKTTRRVILRLAPNVRAQAENCSCIFCIHHLPVVCRQPLPNHLPRIEHRHEPESCTCGQCGKDLVKIGEDVTEQLDVEPAKFFVHRHIRPQYACRTCETVTAAPIPPAVIDGGMAAVGLLTWVLIGKFLDHLPLYRLEQIAARSGVILSRSTLADWVGRLGVALEPLAERLAWHLRQRHSLHADETPVAHRIPRPPKPSSTR